jgi:riboflavin kinase / FMN adenylyltransferase
MSRLLRTLTDFPAELRGGGVAIGNFDAVHIGHAALVRTLVKLSKDVRGPALVFTFDPPPGAVLQPDVPRIKPLTSMTRRAALVGSLGVDALIAFPTDSEFLKLSARQFFARIVVDTLGAKAIVEGPNFRFGRGREGDMKLLQSLCEQSKLKLQQMSIVEADSAVVSSTRIRELVTLGQMAEANQLLLEPYRLEGEVVSGAQRGRLIGFPTANLASIPVLLPALGVYAGRVIGVEDEPLAAAIHIGPNPTFGEDEPKVEVHIANWQGSLYGRRIEVQVLDRVREIRRFPSVDDLQQQLRRDVDQCVARAALKH